jgi:hypothetical protein
MDRLRVEQKVGATSALDETQEIIKLPSEAAEICKDPKLVEFPPGIIEHMTDCVSNLAGACHENSFHSFDRASRVMQPAVVELLHRVATSSAVDCGG